MVVLALVLVAPKVSVSEWVSARVCERVVWKFELWERKGSTKPLNAAVVGRV